MTRPMSRLRVPLDVLGVREEVGSGGQGRVHLIGNNVLQQPFSLVYKEYNAESRAELDVPALEAMVGMALDGDLADRLAWPLALVERGGVVTGFLMRRIPAAFYVRIRAPRDRVVPSELQHFLADDDILSKRQLTIHDRWRLVLLRDTAETMQRLHRLDIAVGDLSPKNLLMSVTTRPSCFFIDCDAMRVAGRSVLPQVETVSWQLPGNEDTATVRGDAFKFGLLAIRLVAGDLESTDPTPLARLSADLGRLAERAIAASSEPRPDFGEWIEALDAAIPTAPAKLPWERRDGTQGTAPVRLSPVPPPFMPRLPVPGPPQPAWLPPRPPAPVVRPSSSSNALLVVFVVLATVVGSLLLLCCMVGLVTA